MKETLQKISRQEAGSSFRLAPRDDDLDPLADLWVASWQAAMPEIDFKARRAWFLAYLKDLEARGAKTICAFTRKHPLGFILLNCERGVLEQIAIWPALFGTGIGALLLDEAKRLCPLGLGLEVNADNLRAVHFYEKAGFTVREAGVNPASGRKIWRMHWAGE